jgi:hypothetical protein
MKSLRIVSLLGVFSVLFGCSTTNTSLRYAPVSPVTADPGAKQVAVVGTITDFRKEEDPRWFGAIRGGFGNPLKKLVGDVPMNQNVAEVLTDALKQRQLLASGNNAVVRIDGTIQVLECNYYFNRDAQAQLTLNIVDARTGAPLYSQSQRTNNSEGGVGAGIFGDVNHLAEFMQKTLSQTIDKFFADPAFMSALAHGNADSKVAGASDAGR